MPHSHTAKALVPGFYPFWFWNDHLTAEEIRRQIAEMAAQGVRGFFIHPRQGLQQPYLSAAFFDMVRVALDAAKSHGMAVHVCDEYPYPSGVAGGAVTLGMPEYYATRLIPHTADVPGGPVRLPLPAGKVLSCLAYPLIDGQVDWAHGRDLRGSIGITLPEESYREAGLTPYNRKRYFASDPTPTLDVTLPDAPHRIYASLQGVVTDHKYWGQFIDVLNPEAMRRFLALTHEAYRQQTGAHFGDTLCSFFSDETSPGWSERLPAAFLAEYGYDLLPLLPALRDETHPEHLRVSADFERLRYRLFCDSYEEQVSQWCRAHGVRYLAEKPSWRLSQLRYTDIPGCEPGHTKAGAKMDLLQPTTRGNARATASAAYFYGKEGSLCECYHSLGWSGTLQDAKLIAEGLLLMGTDYLVPHGFFYSTHNLKKHDAPPSFFYQMPYWPLFGHLAARVERIAQALAGTYIDAQVLVVDPSNSIRKPVDYQAYARLLDLLMEEHLDFLVVDTDILAGGRVEKGRVRLRDVHAAVILLPPMPVIEEPLRRWLDDFAAAGGTVHYCTSDFAASEVTAALSAVVQPRLRLSATAGDARTVQMVTRAGDGPTRWLLLNTGMAAVELRLDAGCPLREIPLDDALPPLLDADTRVLQPFESVLLEAAERAEAVSRPERVRLSPCGTVTVTPRQRNLLRLGEWTMTLLDDENRPLQAAQVQAMPLANQLQQGSFRFAPRMTEYFGKTPEWSLPTLHVRYTAVVQHDYDGAVALVMEPGSIVGDWRVRVNDAAPLRETDFAPTDAHARGSLGYDISAYLQPGENTLTVELTSDRMDGGLRNPLYLAGDFAVALPDNRLVARQEDGVFEDYTANGLPYYAGVIDYAMPFAMPHLPAGDHVLLELDVDGAFQEACELSLNGHPWHPMPWSPRMTLVPTAELQPGANTLCLRVYTTLIRAFEGQYFATVAHETRAVR